MTLKYKVQLLLISALFVINVNAQNTKSNDVSLVGGPVTPYKFTGSLLDLPLAKQWKPGDPIKEIPRRKYGVEKKVLHDYNMSKDPLADLQKLTPPKAINAFNDTIVNIEGQGYTGVNPPDTTGSIGKNYYIQSINGDSGSEFTVYAKDTGVLVAGPISMETLAPASSACAAGDGDPIVLYDEVAERWFLQEFVGGGANKLCFYISATDDPINGGWNFYEFTGATFPDYPHFGVWSDAYYGTANENPAKVYAFDRTNMLIGATARAAQVINLGDLDGYNFQTATPADWDGKTPPPSGAPGIIMRHVDEEAHTAFTNNPSTDLLEMYAYHVDFDNVANSTFTKLNDIVISDFNSYLLDYSSFDTVPQPGGSARLDAIREVILNRLQYRNFGTYEMILGVLPTNIDPATTGSNVNAGLRWFELRKVAGGNWTLHQEGTYDVGVTTQNRLVGSMAMDQSGNIALAYTLTDTDAANPIPPSVAYTGRLATDANEVMTQVETISKIGTGINTSGRWGDYASMDLDPIDDCTYWFTAEYQNGGDWATSITSFKFDQCGDPNFSIAPSQASFDVCGLPLPNNPSYSFDLDVQPLQGYVGIITLTEQTVPSFVTNAVLAPDVLIAPATSNYSFNVDDTGTAGSYTLTLAATGVIPDLIFEQGFEAPVPRQSKAVVGDTIVNTIDVNINYSPALPSVAVLSTPATAGTNAALRPNFAWSAALNALSYRLEVATDNAFVNIVHTATVDSNVYTPPMDLPSSSVLYWRVFTISPCGETVSDVFTFTTTALPGDCAIGTNQIDFFNYDFESGEQGWTKQAITGATVTWGLQSTIVNSGTQAFNSTDLDSVSDNVLISPSMVLPTGQGPLTLRFWNQQSMESRNPGCYDGGFIEVSVDGGAFTQIPNDKLINDAYDGALSALSDHDAWCGDPQAGLVSNVDLDQYAGSSIQLRFRLATDSSVSRAEGWTIDDVKITGCQ